MEQRHFHHSLKKFLFTLTFLCIASTMLHAEVRYAENLSISEYDGYTVALVQQAWRGNEAEPLRYAFIHSDADNPDRVRTRIKERFSDLPEPKIFTAPIDSIVTLSTTYLPPLLMLEEVKALDGVDKKTYVYSSEIRSRIEKGAIEEVGTGNSLDIEQLVTMQPDAVMATGTSGEWNVAPKLRKAGIPVLLNADYLERTPLGRAEWIKFTALLFDKRQEAQELFRSIESRYEELRKKAEQAQEQPKVLLNRPMQDKWVVPGGESYMARFIQDAGAMYLWEENDSVSSLVRDPEAVFSRALEAEYWIHQYGWTSLQDVTAANKSFSQILAYKKGHVVNNDKRVTEQGANDFYESGGSRPDRVLADLIKIFHPERMKDHSLYYYRYLE